MIKKIKRQVKGFISNLVNQDADKHVAQLQQVQMINQYRLMKKLLAPSEMPALNDVGFKLYSQFEEDGMLLYIFSIIGTTSKRVVEICAGDGSECMAANLIINHGWEGLLFEGDPELKDRGVNFFASNTSTWLHPPRFKQQWITRENVDALIVENGVSGQVDLLSLDIDGNDYYIMEAITSIQPRVIVCETQNVIPGELALTIPYKADYNRNKEVHPDFIGVSLLAMTKLLNKKGYRLIGGNRFGFNVFFMHNGTGAEYFPEVSVEHVLNNSYTKSRVASTWHEVKDLPWVNV